MRLALAGHEHVRCVVCFYGLLDFRHLRDQIPAEVPDEVVEDFSPIRHLRAHGRDPPPMLIAWAGLDRPVFNESTDRFVGEAVACGATIDLLSHPQGRHGFDVLDDDDRSREIIARTLDFMSWHLRT